MQKCNAKTAKARMLRLEYGVFCWLRKNVDIQGCRAHSVEELLNVSIIVSILVPASGENAIAARKIRNLLSVDEERLE